MAMLSITSSLGRERAGGRKGEGGRVEGKEGRGSVRGREGGKGGMDGERGREEGWKERGRGKDEGR